MKQNNLDSNSTASIIPAQLAIRAMRDSGYRNTAYALAEIIDNSIQAKAKDIEVVCHEVYRVVNKQKRRRISAIGVLDNGEGMSPDILRLALQFGNGTHLNDRSGIGRFGMGLPNSSISQCHRVEVWTWQNGPDNAYYSYLDVREIESGDLSVVPMPEVQPLPDKWRSQSNIVDTSGTLVVWTDIDEHRLSWRGASTTLQHVETIVGRMYRKFINDGRLAIRFLAMTDDEVTLDQFARVNDPLYLMKNSTTPEPFDTEPMFQTWGEEDEIFTIDYGDEEHEIVVRMSWAREETVPKSGNRGDKAYGKHAAKNLGVSIVRAERELGMDDSWTIYEPTERWWGVEVEFPPTLDEVFGVTNNKQSATIFSSMSQFDISVERDEDESNSDFLERIQSEGDPRALLSPIADHIRDQIAQMRKRLSDQVKGVRKNKQRHDDHSTEDRATEKFQERVKEGHATDYDQENLEETDRDELIKDLVDDKNYANDVARKIVDAVFRKSRRVIFLTKAMDGYAFFNVEHLQGGITAIVFNINHPLYSQLIETLDPKIGEETDKELLDRVQNAADTLELLFAAWARYEMEEVNQKDKFFEIRQEWGKMARFFLADNE